VATAIIGVGVAALMMSLGAGTSVNDNGQKLTRAAFLAQEIREWTLKLPYDSLVSATYLIPRDANGNPITDMPGWAQKVTVSYRDPKDLMSPPSGGASDVAYVQVEITYQSRPVLTTGWLVARRAT